jgi:Spy/CpxP family protein refolding chaperone
MRTVRVLLILAVALMFARPLFAQDQPQEHKARGDRAARGGGGDMFVRLLGDLNLTDEQKTKVKDLAAKYGQDSVLTDEQKKARDEAVAAAKKDGKTGRDLLKAGRDAVKLTDEQKAKRTENFKTLMDEVKKVLTPEQQEKLKAKMAERRGRKPAGADAAK